MTKENEDALWCATELDEFLLNVPAHPLCTDAAAHIRRLVAENEALRRERDANLDTINVDNAIITRLKAEKLQSATALVQQMLEALECSAEGGPTKIRMDAAITAAREWLEGKG